MISFVIPAYNEEQLIGRTLEAIHGAAERLGLAPEGAARGYEVIVVDDASSDRTGEIALAFGAKGTRVVRVEKRQIAAVRNAGAREAKGDVMIFVDADTSVTEGAVRQAMEAIKGGAVGGGAGVRMDGAVPLYAKVLLEIVVFGFRLAKLTGGCFLFCTRAAFDAAGGWDETLYASEEITLAQALKRQGRFVIVRDRVITSGRKLRAYSGPKLIWMMLKIGLRGKRGVRSREGLEFWYGPRVGEGEQGQEEKVQS